MVVVLSVVTASTTYKLFNPVVLGASIATSGLARFDEGISMY